VSMAGPDRPSPPMAHAGIDHTAKAAISWSRPTTPNTDGIGSTSPVSCLDDRGISRSMTV